MKKLCTLFVVVSLTSCASISTQAGRAMIIADNESGHATTEKDTGKSGEACVQNLLGIAIIGDGSINAAKKQGDITHVSSVDYKYLGVLGLYSQVCTQVRGN